MFIRSNLIEAYKYTWHKHFPLTFAVSTFGDGKFKIVCFKDSSVSIQSTLCKCIVSENGSICKRQHFEWANCTTSSSNIKANDKKPAFQPPKQRPLTIDTNINRISFSTTSISVSSSNIKTNDTKPAFQQPKQRPSTIDNINRISFSTTSISASSSSEFRCIGIFMGVYTCRINYTWQ